MSSIKPVNGSGKAGPVGPSKPALSAEQVEKNRAAREAEEKKQRETEAARIAQLGDELARQLIVATTTHPPTIPPGTAREVAHAAAANVRRRIEVDKESRGATHPSRSPAETAEVYAQHSRRLERASTLLQAFIDPPRQPVPTGPSCCLTLVAAALVVIAGRIGFSL